MRLLFLCKRRPQGRDLLLRPYGRFHHIPYLLSLQGIEVCVLLFSYHNDSNVKHTRGNITWYSLNLSALGLLRARRHAMAIASRFRPDWIVGFSDTYYGILAEHLGRKMGARIAIDAYDNYESYIPCLTPLHWLWRKAVRRADVVTAAGPQLASLLKRERPDRPVCVVPMAADPCYLPKLDAKFCRRRLGLPLDAPLVGYCGAIYRNRGIHLLFDACDELRRMDGEVQLVLSGRKERGVRLPSYAKWIGYLPDEDMPFLLNSMNVLAVINRPSAFGRFSYPAKLYEAMACSIPVVATATEPAAWILEGDQRFLARPGDPHDLALKLLALLPQGRITYGQVPDWAASASLFERALRR